MYISNAILRELKNNLNFNMKWNHSKLSEPIEKEKMRMILDFYKKLQARKFTEEEIYNAITLNNSQKIIERYTKQIIYLTDTTEDRKKIQKIIYKLLSKVGDYLIGRVRFETKTEYFSEITFKLVEDKF